MRALVTSVTGYGHLQPLIPLGRALQRAGHDVAVATCPELHPRAEAAGFAAFDAGLDLAPAFARLTDALPAGTVYPTDPSEVLAFYLPHLFGEVMGAAMADDLGPVIESWRPDVVVHDHWELGAPIAAAAAGVPSVSHTLGIRTEDHVLDAIARSMAPLWECHGLEPDDTAGIYRHLCLDITPPGFQPEASARMRTSARPLRPVSNPPVAGEHLPAWVEDRGGAPLVYMTLSTEAQPDVSVFRAAVDGLADTDVDLLVTVGPGRDRAMVGSLPANVHAVDYVPQSLLLPRCAAVICHGGAGSTLNALAHGLPMLLLPQGADQFFIADLVAAAGAGLVLRPGEVRPATIAAAVTALRHEPAHSRGARHLQCEIEAMPGPDEAVGLVEELVAAGAS